MIKKIIFMLLFFCITFVYASSEKYTISVCTTSTLEHALTCKKNILDSTIGEAYIVKENDKYYTYLNIYDDKEIAKVTIKNASPYVKKQKPYIKLLDEKVVKLLDKKKLFINLDKELSQSIKKEELVSQNTTTANKNEVKETVIKQETQNKPKNENQKSLIPLVSAIPDNLELVPFYPYKDDEITQQKEPTTPQNQTTQIKEIDYGNQNDDKEDNLNENDKEELKQISMEEFDRANKENQAKPLQKISKSYAVKTKKYTTDNADLSNIQDFQQIIIEIDSNRNIMKVKAKINDSLQDIRTYIVSTGKNNIKKPLGDGKISQVSINPVWYPTDDTIKSFKKRGIILPKVVPPNNKYNYMGAAKINLTHTVDGKSTYRIHGTLNEKTLGSHESAGCIRMRNSDVLQLANLINEFASSKGLDSINVILY